MSDSEPKNDPANPSEPVMSKPYIMPDDPEPASAEALAREAADARDKMLRTLAEMENLRKRTAKEVQDARTYGVTGFARDVLDIADNLQRALDAVPAEARANADPGLKSLIEGVELTERSLHNTLEKYGVKRLDPSGNRFDPKCPTPPCRQVPWCRWCRPATPSATACCGRPWSASPRAARRPLPRPPTAMSRAQPDAVRFRLDRLWF
jgi:molecular chaperone GrpE (heat shock protein)